MKKRILFLLVVTSLSFTAFGQASEPTNYYVVIGAFAKIDNAVRFTDKANKANFNAQYAIQSTRKLYYVYLFSSEDKSKAFAFLIKIRVETAYKECWVYAGNLGENKPPVVTKTPEVKPPVVIEEPVKPVVVEKIDSVKPEPVKPEPVKIDSPAVKKPEVAKPVVKKPDGKPFYFKLVNAETGNEVMGEVHVQESTRAAQYQAFKGNEISYLKAPVNKEGTYTVITNAPGYQELKTTVTFKTPGTATGTEGEFIIPFELKRAKRGDYIDFNNVHFVRNSSVMTGDSQNEIDGLVALMKENVKYAIKIHGHCNGKATREIIVRGTSDKFFAMDPGKNKKETASDKVLSEERAEAVKAYLVSQGIAADRITTKGEGGKIPLYPEGSTLASYNDRVEVEVKKH